MTGIRAITFALSLSAATTATTTAAQVQPAAPPSGPPGYAFRFPVAVALQRFEIVPGKEGRFAEWMTYLRTERAAAVATLDGEKMYFEAVFSDTSAGRSYAYWLTFQGDGGTPVESSTAELDRRHLEFWNECIVKGSRRRMGHEFYLTPAFLDSAIVSHQRKAPR